MKPIRLALALVTAVLVWSAGFSPRAPFDLTRASAAQEQENEEQLISRGVQLRKDGDDQSARDVFRQAYDRFPSPKAACQLGLAEQALGRWDEAEAHLREGPRATDDPWVKKNREAPSRDLAMVKTACCRCEGCVLRRGRVTRATGFAVRR